MRLQCAATERDGLMCPAEQKIVSSSLLLTRIYFHADVLFGGRTL